MCFVAEDRRFSDPSIDVSIVKRDACIKVGFFQFIGGINATVTERVTNIPGKPTRRYIFYLFLESLIVTSKYIKLRICF